jgi:hypothetical protein
MDAQTILRLIVKRLEPKIGKIRREEADERAAEGILHLFDALHSARSALAFGDENEIIRMGLTLPTIERTGRQLARQHEQQSALRERQQGGRKRGDQQTAAAARIWEPYQKAYWEAVQRGKPSGTALAIVKGKMGKEGFALRGQLKFPSDQTIRKWMQRGRLNALQLD